MRMRTDDERKWIMRCVNGMLFLILYVLVFCCTSAMLSSWGRKKVFCTVSQANVYLLKGQLVKLQLSARYPV